jgi:penicillin-binding protein 1A
MTGGSLPAKTWHEIMAYAHQGVELKNPYGVTQVPRASAKAPAIAQDAAANQRPASLSRRSGEAIRDLESQFRAAIEKGRAQSAVPGRGASIMTLRDGRIE